MSHDFSILIHRVVLDAAQDLDAKIVQAARRGYVPVTMPQWEREVDGAVHRWTLVVNSVRVEDCPDCAQGKHANCTNEAFSSTLDLIVDCPCSIRDHTLGEDEGVLGA